MTDGGPVRPAGRASRVANRKAQLTDLAAELFRRHGYPQVGVQEIAAAAGLTGPAVYRHFRSKQEILAEVLLAGIDAFGSAVDAALATPDAPPAARLRALTAALAGLSVERRDTTALWRWQRRHLEPAGQAAVVQRAGTVMDRWVGELRLARPELDQSDAELLCWAAMSVFGSVAVHHTSLPQDRFAPVLAATADAVLASAVVPAPPPRPGSQPPGQPGGAGGPVPAPPVDATLAVPVDAAPGVPKDAVPDPPVDATPAVPGDAVPAVPAADVPPVPVGGVPAVPVDGVATAPTRREAVLAGATRLFRERGYHAVSMEEIGAAVGIAGPSVYRHFASKGELLCAACTRMSDRLAAEAAAALAAASGPVDALDRLVRSYVGAALAHRDLLAVYAADAPSLPEQSRAEMVRVQREYVQQWVGAARAVAPTLPEAEARVAVHAGLTVVNDLVRTHRLLGRPHLADELAGLVAAALTGGGVTANPPAGR